MAVDRKDMLLANGERQPKHSTGSSGAEWHLRRAKAHEAHTVQYEALAAALGCIKRFPFKP